MELKLDGEAMTPFLARLLEISLNNVAIQCDWKKNIVSYLQRGWINLQSQTVDP